MKRLSVLLLLMWGVFSGCGTQEKVVYVPISQQPGFGSNPLNLQNPPPRPMPEVEKLDEYYKHLVFAERYLEEGDYPEALKEIKIANKYRKDEDPVFYELKGKIYDGIGDREKAFGYLKRAAWIFYKKGNLNKAWELLGWMRTLKPDSPEIQKLEEKLREEEI